MPCLPSELEGCPSRENAVNKSSPTCLHASNSDFISQIPKHLLPKNFVLNSAIFPIMIFTSLLWSFHVREDGQKGGSRTCVCEERHEWLHFCSVVCVHVLFRFLKAQFSDRILYLFLSWFHTTGIFCHHGLTDNHINIFPFWKKALKSPGEF